MVLALNIQFFYLLRSCQGTILDFLKAKTPNFESLSIHKLFQFRSAAHSMAKIIPMISEKRALAMPKLRAKQPRLAP
jgi:hypothetical protein